MSSAMRWSVATFSVVVGLHATATPALGQDWRARGGSPPGRTVRVEQGRARPCPPGLERLGRCDSGAARRGDWCLDRNRDARCDYVTRGRVDRPEDRRDDRRVARRADRPDDRRDDRRDGRPYDPYDIIDRQGSVGNRVTLADRIGDLVRQAQREAQRRGR